MCQEATDTLLTYAFRLPDALVAELRKYNDEPPDEPAELAMQRDACCLLLEAGSIPASLEAELRGYAQRLDYAIDEIAPPPEMGDIDALDAIAGVLLRPGAGDGEMLAAVRGIVARNGRRG